MVSMFRVVPMPRIYFGDADTMFPVLIVASIIGVVLWFVLRAKGLREDKARREALARGNRAVLQHDHTAHGATTASDAGSSSLVAAPPASAAPAVSFASAPVSTVPRPSVAPPPLPPLPPLPQPSSLLDDELDSTRMTIPADPAAWTAVLDDGRRIPLTGVVFFGRSPASDVPHTEVTLVPIDDRAKSMSKTHARIDASEGRLTITDLHSTNGTAVLDADGSSTALTPGVARPVDGDATVVFGSCRVQVRRGVS